MSKKRGSRSSRKRKDQQQTVAEVLPPEFNPDCPEYWARLKQEKEQQEAESVRRKQEQREQRRQKNRKLLHDRLSARIKPCKTSCLKQSSLPVKAPSGMSVRLVKQDDKVVAIPLT